MQLLISLSALLLSVMLVQMGIGALRPFDSISGAALGFTSVDIGLIASGHFAGFLCGCLLGPKLVYRAGHSRAFAILVAADLNNVADPIATVNDMVNFSYEFTEKFYANICDQERMPITKQMISHIESQAQEIARLKQLSRAEKSN